MKYNFNTQKVQNNQNSVFAKWKMYNIANQMQRQYGPGRQNTSLKTNDIPVTVNQVVNRISSIIQDNTILMSTILILLNKQHQKNHTNSYLPIFIHLIFILEISEQIEKLPSFRKIVKSKPMFTNTSTIEAIIVQPLYFQITFLVRNYENNKRKKSLMTQSQQVIAGQHQKVELGHLRFYGKVKRNNIITDGYTPSQYVQESMIQERDPYAEFKLNQKITAGQRRKTIIDQTSEQKGWDLITGQRKFNQNQQDLSVFKNQNNKEKIDLSLNPYVKRIDTAKIRTMDIIKNVIRNKIHPKLSQVQINELIERNVDMARNEIKTNIKYLKRNIWKNKLHPTSTQEQINHLCEENIKKAKQEFFDMAFRKNKRKILRGGNFISPRVVNSKEGNKLHPELSQMEINSLTNIQVEQAKKEIQKRGKQDLTVKRKRQMAEDYKRSLIKNRVHPNLTQKLSFVIWLICFSEINKLIQHNVHSAMKEKFLKIQQGGPPKQPKKEENPQQSSRNVRKALVSLDQEVIIYKKSDKRMPRNPLDNWTIGKKKSENQQQKKKDSHPGIFQFDQYLSQLPLFIIFSRQFKQQLQEAEAKYGHSPRSKQRFFNNVYYQNQEQIKEAMKKEHKQKKKQHPQIRLSGQIGVKYQARNQVTNKRFNPITGDQNPRFKRKSTLIQSGQSLLRQRQRDNKLQILKD